MKNKVFLTLTVVFVLFLFAGCPDSGENGGNGDDTVYPSNPVIFNARYSETYQLIINIYVPVDEIVEYIFYCTAHAELAVFQTS
ncbi:MAG: hypothetical protein FWD26_09860 [Treponema sp.]|nr:hypothetical protein [Treponema sp.]